MSQPIDSSIDPSPFDQFPRRIIHVGSTSEAEGGIFELIETPGGQRILKKSKKPRRHIGNIAAAYFSGKLGPEVHTPIDADLSTAPLITDYLSGSTLENALDSKSGTPDQKFTGIPIGSLFYTLASDVWTSWQGRDIFMHVMHVEKKRQLNHEPFIYHAYGTLETRLKTHGTIPARMFRARYAMHRMREFSSTPLYPTHGDLHQTNIILSGNRMYLVDWDNFQLGLPCQDFFHFSILSDFEKTKQYRGIRQEILTMQDRLRHDAWLVYRYTETSARATRPDGEKIKPIHIRLTEFETYAALAFRYLVEIPNTMEEEREPYSRACAYLIHRATQVLDEHDREHEFKVADWFRHFQKKDPIISSILSTPFDETTPVAPAHRIYRAIIARKAKQQSQ